MSFSLALALYGSVVSTILGLFQIARYVRENRFVSIDATYSCIPNDSLDHEIWIMNRGAGAVTIRELQIGTGIRKRKWGKIIPDSSISLLDTQEDGEPMAFTLGPGEARHFVASAVAVRRQWLDFQPMWREKTPDEQTVQILEVLHSRSDKPMIVPLPLKHFSIADIDALPAQNFK